MPETAHERADILVEERRFSPELLEPVPVQLRRVRQLERELLVIESREVDCQPDRPAAAEDDERNERMSTGRNRHRGHPYQTSPKRKRDGSSGHPAFRRRSPFTG